MLSEITIENFAIIDNLTLEFAPGFNVLTGETGAGKSIILDAVSLLLGSRADNTDIRTGTDRATVEGIFVLGEGPVRDHVNAILAREELQGDVPDTVVLAREVRRGGRNICRINGRTVPLTLLQEVAEGLIDIHGQTEYLSLLKPSTHIDLLDRYGGLMEQRRAFSRLVEKLYELRRELKELMENEQAFKHRAEMLTYQIEEIEAARLTVNEEEELRQEAKLLGSAEALAEAAAEAHTALFEADEAGLSASDQIGIAVAALARLARIDENTKDLADLAESISIQMEELGRGLSHYQDRIEFDPARLAEVELRLDLINQLKRKYLCDSIAEILEKTEQARAELERISNSDARIEELHAREAQLLIEIGREGAALSRARAEAATSLSEGVERELADLRMENARFSVALEQVDDADGAPVGDYRVGFDRTGIDRVEFLISPNLGEPLKPIARIASGGETSRIMLALKSTLSRADDTPTLVFDEIDAGIGGRIGAVVGHKLWMLSQEHQTFVVTHLPQLAGFADRHFKVEKITRQDRTVTQVQMLDHEARVEELTAMFGTEAHSARQNARDLLSYIEQIKQQQASAAG